MAFQFNLTPPQPQKSFFPKGQKNSTANSYYQQQVTNRSIMNEYQSSFCKAPCGLIDTFSYKNRVGCYDALEIIQEEILNLSNFNVLKRGQAKKNILFYLLNPVVCIKKLSIRRIIKQIEEDLS